MHHILKISFGLKKVLKLILLVVLDNTKSYK